MKLTKNILRRLIGEELVKRQPSRLTRLQSEARNILRREKALMNETYTVFVDFPDVGTEELDVDAADEREARMKALEMLKTDYDPGGKIVRVEKRDSDMFF